jgi:hypothetical protein
LRPDRPGLAFASEQDAIFQQVKGTGSFQPFAGIPLSGAACAAAFGVGNVPKQDPFCTEQGKNLIETAAVLKTGTVQLDGTKRTEAMRSIREQETRKRYFNNTDRKRALRRGVRRNQKMVQFFDQFAPNHDEISYNLRPKT